MKDKFIRVLSPITIFIISLFDLATIEFGKIALKKLIELKNATAITFFLLEIFAIVIAIIVTKQLFSDGVKFKENEIEFTALDENGVYKYDDIADIMCEKDESASFVKNFVDRHAILNLTLKDEKEIAIDLGLTTKNTLEKIAKEICTRANIELKPTNTHKRIIKSVNDNNDKNFDDNQKSNDN